ncbi:MAG: hypothetical protein ACI9AR_000025 [Flavobacteriaceae bacterium]|jgi:hypothetical protein
MIWAKKRQLLYFFGTVAVLLFIVFLFILPAINKKPTCFDDMRNGVESGIDCGGDCSKACNAEVSELAVQWARSFEVSNREYNSVAYLENRNPYAGIERISYRFKLLDKENALITQRTGETFINPNGTTAIFEPRIVGSLNRPVVRTTFEFIPITPWETLSKKTLDAISLPVRDFRFSKEESRPRLSGKILNDSLYTLPELELITILYDERGNAVHSSKTELSYVAPGKETDIFFTWQKPFEEKIVREEYIPRFNFYSLDI